MPITWDGYETAYRRGIDGGPAQPDAWAPRNPDAEAIAGAITCSIGVRKGRLFDEAGMDDPAPWADYGAGSLTKQELLELRKRLQDWRKLRVKVAGGDTSDGMARELDELFDDLLYERAGWLRPHAAAVSEAAETASPRTGGQPGLPLRRAPHGKDPAENWRGTRPTARLSPRSRISAAPP